MWNPSKAPRPENCLGYFMPLIVTWAPLPAPTPGNRVAQRGCSQSILEWPSPSSKYHTHSHLSVPPGARFLVHPQTESTVHGSTVRNCRGSHPGQMSVKKSRHDTYMI